MGRSRDFDFEVTMPSPDQVPVKGILIGFLVLLILWLGYSSAYTVKPNEEAVVLRFGKYYSTETSGLHFKIPLVDKVMIASLEEHSVRLPMGVSFQGGFEQPTRNRGSERDVLMLTGDLNATAVEWTIQWKIHQLDHFLFTFPDPDDLNKVNGLISTVAQSVMNRLIGDYSIDEVLTEKRSEVSTLALEATQETLDQYECGVLITDLQMQRITPPLTVKPAFDAVNSAIQKRDQLENEANLERNRLIPQAKAERDRKIRQAEGYAERRRAEVEGEINALRAKYDAYKQAPDVTRRRLYLESMQKVLQNVDSKMIIDKDLNNALPLLRLDEGGEK